MQANYSPRKAPPKGSYANLKNHPCNIRKQSHDITRQSRYAVVDCNSFYCSCERVFRPELNNKPVVVLSNNDGCIVSRSDEVKALGVDMAVPYFKAKECN